MSIVKPLKPVLVRCGFPTLYLAISAVIQLILAIFGIFQFFWYSDIFETSKIDGFTKYDVEFAQNVIISPKFNTKNSGQCPTTFINAISMKYILMLVNFLFLMLCDFWDIVYCGACKKSWLSLVECSGFFLDRV